VHPGRRSLAQTALICACLGACNGAEPAPTAPPPPVTAIVDAAPPPDGITAISGYDPSSHYHLDEDTPSSQHGGVATVHSHRILEILLRSTPSGATVAVDGVIIGDTPTYWEGEFTGREREFTFVMPGYAMARYRFVPTTSGVVHGRLTKIVVDPDAGAPAIPQPVDLNPPGPSAIDARLRPTSPDAGVPPDAAPPSPPPVFAPVPAPLPVVDAGAPPP
jgi:hypothetical protein